MKTSSAEPDPLPAQRSKAWSCLVTNLFVLPGLGSVMARHRVAGYLQMLLALAGAALSLVALIEIILAWSHDFELPNNPSLYESAIGGMAVFLMAWFWSLLTSLVVLRKSKALPKNEQDSKPPSGGTP